MVLAHLNGFPATTHGAPGVSGVGYVDLPGAAIDVDDVGGAADRVKHEIFIFVAFVILLTGQDLDDGTFFGRFGSPEISDFILPFLSAKLLIDIEEGLSEPLLNAFLFDGRLLI